MTYENFWNKLEMEVERSMEKEQVFVAYKKDLFPQSIWKQEPKITIAEPFEKALKKWLRMQKKNRRRWGG